MPEMCNVIFAQFLSLGVSLYIIKYHCRSIHLRGAHYSTSRAHMAINT